jgi:hypothetical protein
MINTIKITFTTDKPLTGEQMDSLLSMISLQLEEPQDLQGNDEEWTATNIKVEEMK